jgi:hypothetical protein
MKTKDLFVGQILWYNDVEVEIDMISSGKVGRFHKAKGTPEILIVPVDEKTHQDNGKTTIQNRGNWVAINDNWVSINDSGLSLQPPLRKVVFKKSKTYGTLDTGRLETLLYLLFNKKYELLLKKEGFKMALIKGTPGVNSNIHVEKFYMRISKSEIKTLMLINDSGYSWWYKPIAIY